MLARFMQKPSQIHLQAIKRVLRYLKGTSDYGIWYTPNKNSELIGYSDSDWAGSIDDMKSTSGYVFLLGNGVFSWFSQKKDIVAQSTADAEYIAVCAAANQTIWLRRILGEMGEVQKQPTTIFCDSKSAIAIAKNPVLHGKTKHIKIKYHFVREVESEGKISLVHCTF
ncbi:secreted RxLR effector protein 161-like [Spinacia oleracea]|uniref:Secreted RxLR effector protein 161-like n=1 Tax=Spinacia oleracea TaxID=3562 RepID=A0ABM3QUS8_SPIOL|nr:secreted RxLR effector protein 161-like [Spinacia oleracea]